MDATLLRDAVTACMIKKDWHGALQLIEQHAANVGPGVARWLEAWVRVTMDIRQVYIAAGLLKESLPLLDGAPGLQAQALLVAAYLATVAHDGAWHAELIVQMRRLVNDSRPEVAPWHGRLMNLQAEYWRGPGANLTKAEALLRSSLEWHHRNVGPYDEHDRRCHMRYVLVALGDLHLTRGQRSEAGARFREAKKFLDDSNQAYWLHYFQGRIAESDHRDAEALIAYERGIADAREVCDRVAVVQIAEAYAGVLRRLREWDRVREYLRPLVTELIHAGIPEGAHRLQLLAVPSCGEEDKTV